MIEFTIETHIERPPGTVFDHVSDPDRLATWQTNTVSAIQQGDGPFGLGTRLREIHRTPGGKEVESLVEVCEYEPGRTLGLLAQPLLQRVLQRQFARQCATLKHVLEAAG
jgi:uncharacterized protein YndB with AHSA1/START domain